MNVQISSVKGFEITDKGKGVSRIAHKYTEDYIKNVSNMYLHTVPKSWIDNGYVRERG